MLRIYLVPPGTGYFFACVCILIATAALYVGAGVAAGFPPHYGALTPEAYVENWNSLASYYGDPVYRLDETGHWEKRDALTVVVDPWSLEEPKVELRLDDAGYVTEVRVHWEYSGAAIVTPPVEEMRYFALAYGAGTGSWWDYACQLWDRWNVFPGESLIGGFSETVGNLALQCTVEQRGFLTSDTMLIPAEGSDAYCTLQFAVHTA